MRSYLRGHSNFAQQGSLLNPMQSIKSLMAFWSDGTIADSQLKDLSGNDRHIAVSDNLITDWNAEFGSTLTNNNAIVSNSTEQAHSGTKSFKLVVPTTSSFKGGDGPYYTTITGEVVNYSFWVYLTAGTIFNFGISKGDGSAGILTRSGLNPTANQWVQYTGSYTETAGGSLARFNFYILTSELTMYVDDMVVSITGKSGIGRTMPNDTVLKSIDTNNEFYNVSGIPLTWRQDVSPRGWNNDKMFIGGSDKMIWTTDAPTVVTKYIIEKNFVDNDYYFDSAAKVATVGAGKTYATIKAALTAITTVKLDERWRIDVYDDFETTTAGAYFTTKSYVSISGVGTKKDIYIHLPESANDTDLANTDCLIYGITGLRNLQIRMKNAKYCCHIDSVQQNNSSILLYNCNFIHYSNQEVIDYRIANSQSYSSVFGQYALGIGGQSNDRILIKNCEVSNIIPIFWHSGGTVGSILDVYNSTLQSMPYLHTNVNPTGVVKQNLEIANLCTNTVESVNLINNVCNSFINYSFTSYTTSATNIYLINDIIVKLYRNTGLTFINTFTAGGSLKITSATSGAVHITGGTAQSVIMPIPDEAGNYSLGRLEVGEITGNANIKLGVRLGDCSSVNKTLTLTVDGVEKTITFNQNFTAQTNAQVLEFINAALAGSATASLYQRAQEYLPTYF